MAMLLLALLYGGVCYAVIRSPHWLARSTYIQDEPTGPVEPHKDDHRWGGVEG